MCKMPAPGNAETLSLHIHARSISDRQITMLPESLMTKVPAENLNPVGTLDRALFAINTLDLQPSMQAHIVIHARAAHLQWRCGRSAIAWSCVDSLTERGGEV
jgi:hypothetical protein